MGSVFGPIRFTMNEDKAIEAIVWVASQCPGIDFYHVAKVLYFADKEHLSRYARPVLGDTYIKMPHGPVPSFVYDLLKRNEFLPGDTLAAISDAVKLDPTPYPAVHAARAPRLDVFSRSDLETLRWALDVYGRRSVSELRELTHQERAWCDAPMNGEMRYEDIIDERTPDREKLLAHLAENAERIVL
jgi:uncharacterized phage-associated protein